MKRFLISPNKNQYKANMHSHTTCSDGKMTPEQHKEAYKARGYSVYAFSDHDKIVDHSDLRDPDFLPLLAAELAVGERSDRHPNHKVCFHFNIIPRDPQNYEKIEIKNFDFSVESINRPTMHAAIRYMLFPTTIKSLTTATCVTPIFCRS